MKVLNPTVRLPSLGTRQRDWGSPGNLTLMASRIWLQDFHWEKQGPQSWRAQTKPCMHQDSEERSRNPTGGWTKTTCTCWRVSCGGVGQQGLTTGMGGLDTVLQSPLWCKPSWRSPLTRPWMPIRLSDFSTETLQATREWHDIFKVMNAKNL